MYSILIIEDEIHFQGILKNVLTDEGFIVDAVFDGEDGILAAKDKNYDLIVTDMHLADMNGTDVIQEILDNNPAQKIVGISGGNFLSGQDMGLLESLQKQGVITVFKKPFNHAEFVKSIQQHLQ
ncbi:MAG: response regulator [Alphaproteobacteria bacterium]